MLFRFRNFPVYKDAQAFRREIYVLSRKFPKDELFVLTSQVRRAVNSILLNIAEGSNKHSDTDFARFLNISLASLEEIIACIDIALGEKYVTKNEYEKLLGEAENLGKQLSGFIKKLRA
ncbi:MAG: four helix bundle protein [Patescibacteria group bacterium]